MKITVKKSRRKTLSLKFITNKEVVCNAPFSATNDEINAFIKSKQSWITKTAKRLDNDANYFKDVLEYKKGIIFGEFVDFTKTFKLDYEKLANEFLPNRIKLVADYYGFEYKSVKIKDFKARLM